MIEGLLAALGWGSADFLGAVVGRRIGSLWTVIIAQVFAALAATAIGVFTGDSVCPVASLTGALVLNACWFSVATSHSNPAACSSTDAAASAPHIVTERSGTGCE